MKNLVIMSQGG